MMIYVCNEKEKGIFCKIYLILEGSTTKAADDNFLLVLFNFSDSDENKA